MYSLLFSFLLKFLYIASVLPTIDKVSTPAGMAELRQEDHHRNQAMHCFGQGQQHNVFQTLLIYSLQVKMCFGGVALKENLKKGGGIFLVAYKSSCFFLSPMGSSVFQLSNSYISAFCYHSKNPGRRCVSLLWFVPSCLSYLASLFGKQLSELTTNASLLYFTLPTPICKYLLGIMRRIRG